MLYVYDTYMIYVYDTYMIYVYDTCMIYVKYTHTIYVYETFMIHVYNRYTRTHNISRPHDTCMSISLIYMYKCTYMIHICMIYISYTYT